MTTEVITIATGSTVDVVLYAKFTADIYTINYELDGGVNGANELTYTIESEITLVDASKEGYIFEGWYTDADFTNKVESIESATGNLVLYAKFESMLSNRNYELSEALNIYPNPSKGNFTIDFGSLQGDKTVKVYSYQGKLIKQFRTNSLQSNVELNQAAGVYVINIETTNGFKTLRLLLE